MINGEEEQFYPKDVENEKYSSNQNIPRNITLKKIEEEDKYSNNEEDEKLGYNSNYKIKQKNKSNTDIQKIEDTSLKIKKSKISTDISKNEINSDTTPRKATYTQYSNSNFIRQRLNSTPITNYFEGMEYYLKDKEPEKNDYQKTGNFIEKEKFFKLNYEAMNIKYKSFDLSEQGKFGTNQNNQNCKIIDDNNDINTDINYIINNPQGKINQINIGNKVQNNTINNINIYNNQQMIMQFPPNKDTNELCKFDLPIYYVRYCDFDSK